MDFSPGLARNTRLRRGAVGYAWASPTTRLAAGYHIGSPVRTCFCGVAKSSMFAEMPLDNRTVDQFADLAAIAGFVRPFEVLPQT
jgi:hypothetical protein